MDRGDQGRRLKNWCGEWLPVLAIYKLFRGIRTEQCFKMWVLLPHLKQRFNLIYYSCSGDPNKVYLRFLMLISIALGCLGCGGNLAGSYKAIVLCQETSFSVRCSILLYYLLIIFI